MRLINIAISSSGDEVTLEIFSDQNNRSVHVLAREELAAAIIMFCKDEQIPLPVKSVKLFRKFYGKLTLVLSRGVPLHQLERICAAMSSESEASPIAEKSNGVLAA